MILLDTHAAIWFTTENDSLGEKSREVADQALADGELAISAVSFWEIALLVAKRRLESIDSAADIRRQILEGGIIELPLTGDIAIVAIELADLHGDPADRFIAATAIAHNATLMTADEALLRWPHAIGRQDAAT